MQHGAGSTNGSYYSSDLANELTDQIVRLHKEA